MCFPYYQSLVLALAIAPMFASAQDANHDWPRWSGPDSNMISTESDWHSDWESHPPTKKWTANVGTGFSSLVVVGQKLYTMGRNGDDEDAVFCLDTETGNEIWRHSYPAALEPRMFEGGPGATPTVADGVVYTLSRQGRAFGLKADTGEVVWDVDTLKLTGAKQPSWGFTSTALVVDDKVVFDVGRLLALDPKTGKEVWKTAIHKAGYGSAIEFDHDSRSCLASLTNEALMVVDTKTGELIAQTKWKTQFETSSSTPVIDGSKLFISTGYKRGCALFELADGKLAKVFENKNLSNHMNNSVLYEGHFYGIHGNSHRDRLCTIVCIDAETGEQKWSERGLGCGSLLIAGDQLVVLSSKGELVCAPATPDGFHPNGRFRTLKGKCWTVPLFLNGRIYCRNSDGGLVCVELVGL
jgi:outer membrane protein assembly factor BamB